LKHKILGIISISLCVQVAWIAFAAALSPTNKVGVFPTKPLPRHLKNEIYIRKFKDDRDWSLRLELNQRADFWDSRLENSVRYRIYLTPTYSLQLSKNFFLDASVSLGSTIGSVQSRFGDLRADDFIFIRDARMYYRIRNQSDQNDYYLSLSAGAIEQRRFLRKFDLFMSARALPGLEQVFKYEHNYSKTKSFGFDLRFFEGIPTSQANTLDFSEKEKIPFLTNGRFEGYLKNMSANRLGYRIAMSFGIFDFSELPAVISDESRLFGNTVDGIGPSSEFRYDYRGWYGGWNAIFSFSRFEIFPYVDMVTNLAAPSGRNQGQRAGVHLKWYSRSSYSIDLEPFTFFNESDASVASYNGTTYGHNNREGFGINLALDMRRKNLKFWLTYVYSDVLEQNMDLQIPFHFGGFKMEYRYEI
jgi:hypothetical protein